MQQLMTAMESTSAPGLPRIVSSKPLYVRIFWLLMCLLMLALFLKGFSEFVVKLQSNPLTSTLAANSEIFQFPDVYVCFENSISGSYSATVDQQSADAINAALNATSREIYAFIASLNQTGEAALLTERDFSFLYPRSLPYSQMIDALTHRKEQSVIGSRITYNSEYGSPVFEQLDPTDFYHPQFLRCFKWTLNSTYQSRVANTVATSGIVAKLLIDNNYTDIAATGATIQQKLYFDNAAVPTSDWSLSTSGMDGSDRSAGIRVFLTPPGEYPSDFTKSFSLGPGKHHTVEIDMTKNEHKLGQFDCVNEAPDVQFVNHYDQTPYSHTYSYSYCYYYEYHRQYQAFVNMSGDPSPLPWPLRHRKFATNLTGRPNFFIFLGYGDTNPSLTTQLNQVEKNAQAACETKWLCSTLDYSVSISSADWPTQSSLAPFVSSSIRQAWTKAKAKNLSVPALDFLLIGDASSVASYVRSNLLKVHFKPRKRMCNRLTFSFDYGFPNFISDIGGIMGIYLGISLLTLCELFELFYDLFALCRSRVRAAKTGVISSKPSDLSIESLRVDAGK